jgi:CheY-like chemotaxis protein
MSDKKLTIMVLEDESILLHAISKKLEFAGINVVPCTGAKEAIDYLKNSNQTPDAIWLDYYLKEMNGMEFVTEIKKNENWCSIPVIVVSNSASDEKVKTMFALGVSKYLLKAEYRLDDIIKTIIEVINSHTLNKKC